MRKYVNQSNYVPKTGRKIKGKSVTQLVDYQPFQKTLANLTIAGLNASAKQALEFYDSNVVEDIDIPLLPRHISPDIVSVHEASLFFAQQKALIEERVAKARAEHVEKLKREQSEPKPVEGSQPSRGGGAAPPSPQAKS